MEKNKFSRNPKIARTSKKVFSDYEKFRDDLRHDFYNSCGYCGSSHNVFSYFEIDHFIPKKQFLGRDDSLLNSYSNLVYCCRKCNRTKSSKYQEGNNPTKIENIRFYDPGSVNYNDYFFRDKYGFIKSDDNLGKKMIIDLKLYNPIYGIAWMIEEINNVVDKIDAIAMEIKKTDPLKAERIEHLSNSLNSRYRNLSNFLNNTLELKDLS